MAVAGTEKRKRNHMLATVVLNVGISFQATAESELQGIQGKALAIRMEVRCAPKVVVFANTRPLRLKRRLNVFIPTMGVAGILPLLRDLLAKDA